MKTVDLLTYFQKNPYNKKVEQLKIVMVLAQKNIVLFRLLIPPLFFRYMNHIFLFDLIPILVKYV